MYIGKKILQRKVVPAPKAQVKKPLLLTEPQPVPVPIDWPGNLTYVPSPLKTQK